MSDNTVPATPSTSGGTAERGTDPDALARAVAAHAVVLPPIGQAGDADLGHLDDVIGDARVVAVGEGAHFVAEFGGARRRLIRCLAERHGFTVVAAEFGFAEAFALDSWMQGRGEVDDLAGHEGTTNSGIDGTMARWLREHNATSRYPLRFLGLDTPIAGGSLRPLLEPLIAFYERADPEVVSLARRALEVSSGYEALSNAGAAARGAAMTTTDRTWLTATLSRLSVRMHALRPRYLERTDTNAVDLARRRLDIAVAADYTVEAIHELLFAGAGLPLDTSIRDRAMADSMLWHLDRAAPGERVVLLAHNNHVQKVMVSWGRDGPDAYPLGVYLADTLGEGYRTIALTHTAPRVPELHPTDENPHGFDVADVDLEPPPPDGVEGAINAAGLAGTVSLLPLAMLRADPGTRPRSITAQSAHLPLDVPAAFDAVITLPHITTHAELTLQ